LKTWLDRICDPLENPKFPQIKYTLAEYDRDGKVIGKCAEGEIACQNKIPYKRYQTVLDDDDFRLLGIPEDLVSDNILPIFDIRVFSLGSGYDLGYSISNYLFKLNDAGFTYPEIAEFMRTTFEDAV